MLVTQDGLLIRLRDVFAGARRTKAYVRALGVISLLALGYLLASLPLRFAMLLVVGTIGATLLLLKPALGLYLLAFTIPFGSLFSVQLAGASVGPSDLLLGGMLVSWLLRMAATRQAHIAVPPVAWVLAAYLGAIVLSLLNASSLTAALPELLKWVQAWLLLVLVANLVTRKERLPICMALLLAGLLEAALGIYQFLGRVGPPGFMLMGRYMRAYGTFEQPNPFGGYLGLVLPLAYALVLVFWRPSLDDHPTSAIKPVLFVALAATALMLLALVMSWSRGALLGLVSGLVLVGLALGKKSWLIALALLPLIVLLAPGLLSLAPTGFIDRMLDTVRYVGQDLTLVEINDETFSLIERAAHWQAAWRMFSARPWLGVGIGQYAVVYPQVAVPRWQDPLGHAHNIYLHLLAEGGLLGLASHLLFWAAWLFAAFRRAWQNQGVERAIALGALGMLGHLLAHSLVDNLYVHGMYLMMALLLGLLYIPSSASLPLCKERSSCATDATS